MTPNPYLNFDGTAEEACRFYKSVFGGEFAVLVRFKDMGGPPGATPAELERIAHISLPLGNGAMLMASDIVPSAGHTLTVGNNFYVSLQADSAEEAQRLYEGLSAGGHVGMPLGPTPWAEKFASFTDRFGVQWMVNYAGAVQFQHAPAS
jgi:PhnB protein